MSAAEVDVTVAYRAASSETDAILAYSGMLVDAINEQAQLKATLVTGAADGSWEGGVGGLAACVHGNALLLQYNPFSYGRWGFAPWLLRDVVRLRRQGVTVAVMVHEAFVEARGVRQSLLSGWQRLQLRELLRRAEIAFASTSTLMGTLRTVAPGTRVEHLPVSSNLPDRRGRRAEMRDRLGLADGTLALVAFGTGHPSQLQAWLGGAASAAADRGGDVTLLNLGAGAPEIPHPPRGVTVRTPGRLPEEELAGWLAAGDLFVAPFSDGVSTRRTTVMAALQHGLPVVTSRGANTDDVFLESSQALRLTPADDPRALEAAVADLAGDERARVEMGAAGRELFDRRFAWPVIARSVAAALTHRIP